MPKTFLIKNALLVSDGKVEKYPFFAVKEGVFVGAVSEETAMEWTEDMIDAQGLYLAPGFVDIHVHGGGGADFMDGTEQAFHTVCKTHALHGTTSLVPTTFAGTEEEQNIFFKAYRKAKKNPQGAKMLGIHLEGPYLSTVQSSAYAQEYLREPQKEEYKKVLEKGKDILRWSVAPELEGALEMGKYLKERGVVASIAHSNATSALVHQAVENGYSLVTHLYMGMSIVRRINGVRVGGVVEAAFLLDKLSVELLADGVHLPLDMIEMVYKIKGPDKVALITNSMRAAGKPLEECLIGGKKSGRRVTIADGVAKLMDGRMLAGSVATADTVLKTAVQAGISLVDAVTMFTETPARLMGKYPQAGTLNQGQAADFVLLDKDLAVVDTYVNGCKQE